MGIILRFIGFLILLTLAAGECSKGCKLGRSASMEPMELPSVAAVVITARTRSAH